MKTIDVLRPAGKTNLAAALVSALFFIVSLATVAYAQDAVYAPGEILVGVKEEFAIDDVQAINAQLGAVIIYKFEIIDAYQLRLPEGLSVPAAIDFYKRQPEIKYAEPNYIVYADLIPRDPRFRELWGLRNTGQTGGRRDADIDAEKAWNITVGSEEIVVASIDTGVDYNHEDLAANMWTNPGEIPDNGIDDDGNGFVDDVYGWDFYNNDNDPMDDNGHGTHTSGTIGAVGNNRTGVVGVCWKVKIMALKFLSAEGSGTIADAVKCLFYAKNMGARLSNNSWGSDRFSWLLRHAIRKSPLFIASAGNDNQNTDVNPHYPSSYRLRNIISVAATEHNDERAWFSNYGRRTVDLGAPGDNILSTLPGDDYGRKSGTSMAAPHVAGVAALIMGIFDRSDLEVKWFILRTVDRLPDLRGKVLTGGRLNAKRALRRARLAAAPSIAVAFNRPVTNHQSPRQVTSHQSPITLLNAFPSPANPEV
ncbi:MAG: S8 family peptidase, partial [bacterium]